METIVIARSGDRWLERLLGAVVAACGANPLVVHTLRDAELAVAARTPDLVVFDPSVAGTDYPFVSRGFRCVGWLGSRSSPVVAALLGVGADDVLDASMGDEEVTARLSRCLHREVPSEAQAVAVGRLWVDVRTRSAEWDGEALPLTAREVEVLQVLVAAQGQPVRRDMLYRLVWRWAMPRGDRTVDVNVRRLRGKLAEAGASVEIETHRGVGYQLRVSAESAVTEL